MPRKILCNLALVSLILLNGVPSQAQTVVEIGYHNSLGSFQTDFFGGSSAFINTGTINAGYTSALDPLGLSGNAIIVTPVSDPMIHFNSYSMTNMTVDTFLSVTLRMPQYSIGDPRRTQLGFLESPFALGVGSNAANFQVAYLDPMGSYNGDALAYTGAPVYSTLHFYQGVGSALIAPGQAGTFNFHVGYPAAQAGLVHYFMDVVPGTLNTPAPNAGIFNTPNPGGGIMPFAPAPEPATIGLTLLGLLGLGGVRHRCRQFSS